MIRTLRVSSTTTFFGVLCAATFISVACIGLIHVAYPFGGDQALFTLGAQTMHNGGVLYRDFWDLKQPAIYLFYLLAGNAFGFTDTGIHVFELLYFLGFSIVLQLTLRPRFRFLLPSAIAPLLVVGLYYANATPFSLTQAEVLAAVPLYLALRFTVEGAATSRNSWFVAAGLMGAIALSFKLLFLPVVLAMWVAAAFNVPRKNLAVLAVTFTLGTCAWIIATMAVCGEQNVVRTFFTYPAEISRIIPPASLHRLMTSVRGYAAGAAVLIALGVFAIYRKPLLVRDPLWRGCVGWLAGGLVAILLQRQSWWYYHMQLLMTPLGVLAAYGVDELCGVRIRARDVAVWIAALFLLVAFPLKHVKVALADLAHNRFATNAAEKERFQELVDLEDHADVETQLLRSSGALPGPIYVAGDPRYYLAAHRMQAVSINGWSLELLVPSQWIELRSEIAAAQPAYIFVASSYRALIPQHSPQLVRMLETRYRLVRHDAFGNWYQVTRREVGHLPTDS